MMPEGNRSRSEALLERPLSARSLVASLLLRTQPPRMRGARCVQWCGLFGVAEGTTRVALSRMVESGELRTSDGVYELAGRVRSRRRTQDWSLDPQLAPWNGEWRVAVVTPAARDASERNALREEMRRLRYASPREGMWTRPDNLPRDSGPAESWRVVDAQCVWWSGRPDGDPAGLARELFAPVVWVPRAEMLTSRLARVTDAMTRSGDSSLAEGFVVGAAGLAHLRSDPLLPRELAADAAQAGEALRRAYRNYERVFSTALRTWFQQR